MCRWETIPEVLDDWVLKSAAPAYDVRRAAASVPTRSPVGYYFHPDVEKVALFAPLAERADLARCKAAAERAVGRDGVRPSFLSYEEIAAPEGHWVKVAYSQTLRRLGELLNFFPGQYPGGVPNFPSPVAAMLTSGLVGAGLGYGAGRLGERFLPEGYGGNLARTGMLLGAGLGAAPGAVWGLTNRGIGRPFNDPTVLHPRPDSNESEVSDVGAGLNYVPLTTPPPAPPSAAARAFEEYAEPAALALHKRGADLLGRVPLGALYKQAVAKAAQGFGAYGTIGGDPDAADVDINALGQTLWDSGASPHLAATTMSALYAAQQLPDPDSRPGWATGHQLGQLAANAAGDYGTGLLAGAALNAALGTPFRASTFGAAGAALGIIGAVVPKLFGQ